MLGRSPPTAAAPVKRRRGPCLFRQRDVTKALRAVTAAGLPVAKVEVGTDGKIIVTTGKPSEETERNPWDEA
jgi:hypothetical protein